MARLVGIDTSIFIYLFEDHPRFAAPAARVLKKIERGTWHGVFSSIGMIELLTGPKKAVRFDIAAEYVERLSHFPNLSIIGMNERIVDQASSLRAQHGIGTADAIHVATAITEGATTFVTNDSKLEKKIDHIVVKILQ